MKILLYLITLFSFTVLSDHSEANIINYYCEVGRVSGDEKTLTTKQYKNIKPSIIIDTVKKSISLSYLEHGELWQNVFKIYKENNDSILAIKDMQVDKVRVLHFNKKNETFSYIFLGFTGNTLSYGKCFK